MRVLIACEFSGIVRDAFRAHGHDAMSCDLLPTERPGPHYQGDVRDILNDGWDLLIAHPDCTYHTNSGVQWLHRMPKNPKSNVLYGASRWTALDEAAVFFRLLLHADIPRIAVENPIPHRYSIERIGRSYDQIIQPYDFGHGETKATCLWLKGLPPLMATSLVSGREGRIFRMPPSATRSKDRSVSYTGIAEAMADQWSDL